MNGSAERMRRLRARERDGKVRVTLQLTPQAINDLRRLGWLVQEADPQSIRRATVLFMRSALRADHLSMRSPL